MATVLCVLYDDPINVYAQSRSKDDAPTLPEYPSGQRLPTPSRIGFEPDKLLGSVSGELGLRKFLESQGHRLIVASGRDGPNSEFKRALAEADVVISRLRRDLDSRSRPS